ncbi:MAG: hypothetical protein ABI557_10975 [Aureliella sp.]
MDAELQQALQSLPAAPAPQAPWTLQVAKLAQLVDSKLPLQAFLEQLLPQLCSLFSGTAAVTWMNAHGTSDAIVGVRYQMDKLVPTAAEQRQHERLVQMAWRQPRPLLVERTDGPRAASVPLGAVAVNTTGHWLLFAPIKHCDEPLALLEIALGKPAGIPTHELTPNQRQLFVRAAELVAQRIYGGLRQRIALPPPSIAKAVNQLDNLTSEVSSLQLQIRQRIEQRLQMFQSWAFSSLADKQAFAKHVQQLLDSHGLRVECTECGHAAILRGLRIGNAKHGAFVFDHYLDSGRTFHGGSTSVPLIRVVPKPARRAAANNPA